MENYRFAVTNPKGETTYETTDKESALEHLASALTYQYIHKSAYIKRITRRNNYDGTETFVVIHDNGYRWTITVRNL